MKKRKLHYEYCDDKDDLVYGYSEVKDDSIHVNVQYIWKKYKCEDKFISNFCGTYDHEVLHLVINEIAPKTRHRTIYGEEKVVRMMMGERFNRKLRAYYARGW